MQASQKWPSAAKIAVVHIILTYLPPSLSVYQQVDDDVVLGLWCILVYFGQVGCILVCWLGFVSRRGMRAACRSYPLSRTCRGLLCGGSRAMPTLAARLLSAAALSLLSALSLSTALSSAVGPTPPHTHRKRPPHVSLWEGALHADAFQPNDSV